MWHQSASLLGFGLLVGLATACATPGPGRQSAPAAAQGPPHSMVLFITDGGGTATWSLARIARGEELAVARMPVQGLVDTRNVDGRITDSAAGATAYAIGRRTFNGGIGVDAGCRQLWVRDSLAVLAEPAACAPRETLLEAAEAAGKATGLITTTWVTDATPAAFAAHAPDRYMHADIAPQMLSSGVDVLMGGGRAVFDGTSRVSPGDLLSSACAEADCPADAAALEALRPTDRRLIGLFSRDDLPRSGARSPTLPVMTEAALERLGRDPDGFFLLVETEATDTEQHANQPIEIIQPEVVEFDRAIEVALEFAERRPETLVVVTADHETGGMSLLMDDGQWTLIYGSEGHTGAMVPLFASGPGAERLAGIRDNDEVGRILRGLLLGGG